MTENIRVYLEAIFGPDRITLTIWQMATRALVVYVLGIILLRINKRFMNVRTVYNFFLYILLGSILASVILGITDLLHSLGTIIIIMAMNILTNMISYMSPTIEYLLKGKSTILVENGKIQWKGMRRNWITKDELMNEIHAAGLDDISNVKKAIFENSGSITVIKK